MKDLIEILKLLGDDFVVWIRCLISPLLTCDLLLRSSDGSDEFLKRALRLWAVSSFMTFALQIPLLRLAGIDAVQTAYVLPSAILWLLYLLLIGIAIHVGLKIFKIPSVFSETLLIYASTVGPYGPISFLISMP